MAVVVKDSVISFGDPYQSLSFSDIAEIAIYKRDEIVTDLICCDLSMIDGRVWTFHEEMPGFDDLITAFERQPGFAADWRDAVVRPAFAENCMVVFRRVAGR